jgi:hypothetical protein
MAGFPGISAPPYCLPSHRVPDSRLLFARGEDGLTAAAALPLPRAAPRAVAARLPAGWWMVGRRYQVVWCIW